MRQKIGQIFIEKCGLLPEHLAEGLALQKEQAVTTAIAGRERIGEILVRLKHLSEESVILSLAHQWNIPYSPTIDLIEIDTSLTQSVPLVFAKKHLVLPLRRIGKTVEVATCDPLNQTAIDDLRLLLKASIKVIAVPPRVILSRIHNIYEQMTDSAEQAISDLSDSGLTSLSDHRLPDMEDLLDANDEAPMIRLVNSILFEASKQRASDIHIEPFEKEMIVRYRVDGVLYPILTVPKRLQSALTSRVKIMAGMNIAEKRLPQDGRISIRMGGREIDIRVSDVPIVHGERMVLRLLDKTSLILTLGEIGLSDSGLSTLSRLIERTHGIFLATGPTGSGKTTTLYAALQKINSTDKNVITIEDPIEYQLKGVGQIQVNPKIDLTFGNGLRSILRQDPDIIMVGEIRDVDTAQIAIHASLTGHLVLSTLHTNDSAGAITRLLDMGVEPFLVSSSVLAIIAQRLVRLICKECKTAYAPAPDELKKLGVKGNMPYEEKMEFFYRGKGCPACLNTGYYGRVGIYELLLITDEIRHLILAKADANKIKSKAMSSGMLTLREEGIKKVIAGITTTEEILRVTHDEI
ncbi:MAG: type II secretion system ATPase GspE [Nitrospirae bacterium]|nr:type II secretion system ATPase GspE [Candidatus Troglogloeales bacterium]MBI3598473.1 type II secretion system ATPase GspE [Candidatus Troglogloeales bacterium]